MLSSSDRVRRNALGATAHHDGTAGFATMALLFVLLCGSSKCAASAPTEHPFAPIVHWIHETAGLLPPIPNLPSTNFSKGCQASLEKLVGFPPKPKDSKHTFMAGPGSGLPPQLTDGYALLFAEATAKYAFQAGMLNFAFGQYDQGDFTVSIVDFFGSSHLPLFYVARC